MPSAIQRIGLGLAIALALGTGPARADPAAAKAQRFHIGIAEDGVYRVDFRALEAAGLSGPVASAELALGNRGQSVPVRIDDGGDGRFGPGDGLVFVGEHLRGDDTYRHAYARLNVYVLKTNARHGAARLEGRPVEETGRAGGQAVETWHALHLEQDLIQLPLTGRTGPFEGETLWYWLQLNHLASEPTRIPLDLARFDSGSERGLELTIQLRGGSDAASSRGLGAPDHAVEIGLNGAIIGEGRWNGRDTTRIHLPDIPADRVRGEGDVLEIRVPGRSSGAGEPIIDVVYLDWIEARFPHDGRFTTAQAPLSVPETTDGERLRLRQAADAVVGRIELFGVAEVLSAVAPDEAPAKPTERSFELALGEARGRFWLVPDGRYREVASVEARPAPTLAADRAQRDHFVIAHGSLVEAVRPLAKAHERRGLRTQVIDVQDIYDAFNDGIAHPRAIRDFLAHARVHRDPPAPSHVLLVGDADWYAGANGRLEPAGQAIIPSWQLRSRDGPAASDHPFVMLEGDDLDPDMAIGRFPARTPDQARAMVAKTLAYLTEPPAGPWRSRVLLVSDSERNLDARNERLASLARAAGLEALEVLAGGKAESAEAHQSRLRSHIDEGALVLHFFGHGGRYMWQTAPSQDNAGNLFDMDDLDRLAPSRRLPIVLSMSCNTGPFDHPAADSLAEKFIRMEDRGAVAVVAASARNSPSMQFTDDLLDNLLGGATVGQAFQRAKQGHRHADAVWLYNLLGDPALLPARPE